MQKVTEANIPEPVRDFGPARSGVERVRMDVREPPLPRRRSGGRSGGAPGDRRGARSARARARRWRAPRGRLVLGRRPHRRGAAIPARAAARGPECDREPCRRPPRRSPRRSARGRSTAGSSGRTRSTASPCESPRRSEPPLAFASAASRSLTSDARSGHCNPRRQPPSRRARSARASRRTATRLRAAPLRFKPRPSRLEAPVRSLKGAGPKLSALAAGIGLETLGDLLWHLPHGYRDRSNVLKIGELRIGEEATVLVEVRKARVRPTRNRRLRIVEAEVADDSGATKAIWFNQAWLLERLRPGTRLLLSGQARPLGIQGLGARDHRRRRRARARDPHRRPRAGSLGDGGAQRRPRARVGLELRRPRAATRSSRCRQRFARSTVWPSAADALAAAHFPWSAEARRGGAAPPRFRGALPPPGRARREAQGPRGQAPRRAARPARRAHPRAGSPRSRSSRPTGSARRSPRSTRTSHRAARCSAC